MRADSAQRDPMDLQYYKRLFVSITGIYSVYLTYGLVQEKMFGLGCVF